jgi:hypothetical protein
MNKKPITTKELIGGILGALLVFGIFGGVILLPEYPIFKILMWILCLSVVPVILFLKK